MLRAVRRTFAAVALLPLLGQRADAQAACTVGTLADYIALGSGGCTLAGFRLSGFTPDAGYAGRAASNPGSIVLTPFLRPVESPFSLAELGFTVSFLTPFEARATQSTLTGASMRFDFQVDGAGGTSILRGVNLGAMDVTRTDLRGDFWTGPYAGGLATIYGAYTSFGGRTDAAFGCRAVGLYCMGMVPSGGIVGALDLRVTEMRVVVYGEASAVTSLGTPPDAVYYASLNSFDAGVSIVTPEPSTWALLGAGLLAVGGLATRRRRQG